LIEIMRKIVFYTAVFLAAAVFFSSDAGADEKRQAVDVAATRIAVFPFRALVAEEGTATVTCPVCSTGFSPGRILPGAEKIVEAVLIEALREYKNIEIISAEKSEGVFKRTETESLKSNLLNVCKKSGRELEADYVVVGFVFRYVERIGYDYSAEKPASVGFDVHVLPIKDGGSLWHGVFDKTQKSLMEDAFQISSFFKGGGKWLTVRQLTRQGMEEVLKKIPVFEREKK